MNICERFLKYVKIETTSNPKSGTHPSSIKEFDLAKILVKDMKELNIKDISLDDKCYIYGTYKANSKEKLPTIGLIAHMDTSCDMSAKDINPQIIKNYDGGKITLNKQLNITMNPVDFPFLNSLKGRTIITTDGTTLLGADDKAGICEILEAINYLEHNKDIIHGDIKICFTPDEEIGEGTDFINLEKFKCDYAYSLDGDKEGCIEYENFNAASAKVTINGINIHPGSAKGHMLNSILIAQEFNSLLPTFDNPAYTEKYEGFNHLNEINGNVEKTTLQYIIRNHDKDLFLKQKNDFKISCDFLNSKYNSNTCELEIVDSYYNMAYLLKDHMEIVQKAIKAIEESGVEVIIKPIRGGTDGAMLTYKGIMCPNLGTGGFNYHGRYELVSLEGMEKAVQIIINIIKNV